MWGKTKKHKNVTENLLVCKFFYLLKYTVMQDIILYNGVITLLDAVAVLGGFLLAAYAVFLISSIEEVQKNEEKRKTYLINFHD